MCGCGRKRAEQVTSVQAAQSEADRRSAADAALARLEAEAIAEAVTYTQSAINAARNASS